ncbi:hypothetical protein EJ110_NYTH34213 [Nymphaea thermarum]|nr:hypothetical protein EJ110_NYTH34213 [Nymphaea thermarum]
MMRKDSLLFLCLPPFPAFSSSSSSSSTVHGLWQRSRLWGGGGPSKVAAAGPPDRCCLLDFRPHFNGLALDRRCAVWTKA